MSDFCLSFRPYPDAASPLEVAEVPWDTALFGFPCWELRCSAGTTAAAVQQFVRELGGKESLLVSKIPTRDVELGKMLTGCGFYLVETQLEIAMPLNRPGVMTPARGAALRPATEADLPAIADIAGASFTFDRYHMDITLSRTRADERFRGWAERGFRDGEPVFVYEDTRKGAILGFYHIRDARDGAVDLSLAAVAPAYHGAGIGALMYQAMLNECRQRGYRTAVTRISLNNLPVANLFFSLGFTIREAVTTFHRHEQPDASEGA